MLLVLRALGLGDFLTGIPALRAIAGAFQEHLRILAAPPALAPLVRLSGTVDRLVPCPGLELAPKTDGPVDLAVNLHGKGPQSHRLLAGLGPSRLIAFRHPEVPGTEPYPQWRYEEHEVARWCRMLDEFGIPADPGRLQLRLPQERVEPRPEATILHAGASSGSRRWPPERWAEVARSEAAAGRTVLLTGSIRERLLTLWIAGEAGIPAEQVLAGSTDLEQLALLVAGAGRVVCGDTGVAHLATAVGTPSVVLFGPTSPSLWGPPENHPLHRVLWKGGTGDPHGATTDPGLMAIQVAEVVQELESLPARLAAGATA